ncbi:MULTISPECIES: HAD family hydrolase [Limnochorda]|uniref:HAD family hydrolase n=1 Tax=Limnochorda TaxID=1676651 RepID=UPI0017DA2EDB|nr:HAD family hydrolase [Limnochorda pilosa]MBO2487327.1 hypothetical protein [Bacillota bacterium]MBO2520098.1 hypothetical protein [Bacillota bacterium]NMA72395.1 HAD family hydrolase [Bacillota bacterium]
MKPYLFFDAGGTVIFPDFARAAELLQATGHPVDAETLFRAFSVLLYRVDRPPAEQHGDPFPQGLGVAILEEVGVPSEQAELLARQLANEPPGLDWAATFPWVKPALEELRRQGYGMSIISNSDGRVAERLAHAGLDHFFDRIYDSAIVGYEKPHPGIFQKALDELGLDPAQCLHVGDLYYADVLGANRAGVGAVLLDPFGLSVGRAGLRIRTIADYPEFLAGIHEVTGPAFHPLAGQ